MHPTNTSPRRFRTTTASYHYPTPRPSLELLNSRKLCITASERWIAPEQCAGFDALRFAFLSLFVDSESSRDGSWLHA